MASKRKYKIVDRFDGMLNGETFDWRIDLDDLDETGAVTGPTDVAAPATMTVELWNQIGFTDVGPPAAAILQSWTFGAGIVRGTPAPAGFALLQIRSGNFAGQVEGQVYWIQGWFDRAGDDANRIPIFGGRWCWFERGVAMP